jgi:hypothetical protein
VLSNDCSLFLLDSWPLRCALCFPDWDGLGDHDRVHRQLSVSSDSKLLDEDIREEARVILRPKKPPRPKSEVFLNKEQQRRTKRYSAFGVSPCASPQRPGGILLFTIRELFANGRWIIISFPSAIYIYIYVHPHTYTHTVLTVTFVSVLARAWNLCKLRSFLFLFYGTKISIPNIPFRAAYRLEVCVVFFLVWYTGWRKSRFTLGP